MALTPEHREKMRLGRLAAAAKRQEAAASSPEEAPEVMPAIPYGDKPLPAPVFEDEGKPIGAPDPQDDFGRFLAAQDAETIETLGQDRLRVIWEVGEKKAKDLRREELDKRAQDRALQHAKGRVGLIPPEEVAVAELRRRNARKVIYTPDLPELSDVGLRINGRVLYHGQAIMCTYGEYLSFIEIEWRNKSAELDFEGKGRLHHLRRSLVAANPVKV